MSQTVERAKNSNARREYSLLGSRCMISSDFLSPSLHCSVDLYCFVVYLKPSGQNNANQRTPR